LPDACVTGNSSRATFPLRTDRRPVLSLRDLLVSCTDRVRKRGDARLERPSAHSKGWGSWPARRDGCWAAVAFAETTGHSAS